MAKEKQKIVKPNYDFLFSCLDYDSEKVNAYFKKNINAILENLDKETSLFNRAVENIFEYTDNEVESLNQEIKKQNEKTFKEFEAYNKLYAGKKALLDNADNSELNSKKEELNKYLEKADKIKSDFRYRRFLLEQEFKTKNQELLAKYDEDYKTHLNTIFKFKETILSINDEHYKRAESIILANQKLIDEMEKAIKHYKTTPQEYESSNELLLDLKTRIELFENELNITPEILLDEATKNNKELTSKIDKNYEEFSKSLDVRREYIRSLLLKAKNDHDEFVARTLENIESIHKMLDEAYQEYKTSKNYKMVKVIKKEKFLLDQKNKYELKKEAALYNAKERMLNHYLLQIDRLDNRSNAVCEKVNVNYEHSFKANYDLHEKMLPDFKEIINGIKHDLDFTQNNIASMISPTEEIKHSFDVPLMNTKLNVLKNMQKEMKKSLSIAKELDDLSFEILAMEPIIAMKQLELENEYLTIDDSTELNISILKLNLEEYKLLEEIGLEIKCIKQTIANIEREKQIKINNVDAALKKDLLTISSNNRVEVIKLNEKIVSLSDNKYLNVNELLHKYNEKKISYLSKKNRQIALSKYALLLLKEKVDINNQNKLYEAALKKFTDEKEAQLRQIDNVTQIERVNYNNRIQKIDETLNQRIEAVKKNIASLHDESNLALTDICKKYDHKILENQTQYRNIHSFLTLYSKRHNELMDEILKPLITINIDKFDQNPRENYDALILPYSEENIKNMFNSYLEKRLKLATDNDVTYKKNNDYYLNRYMNVYVSYYNDLTNKYKKWILMDIQIKNIVYNFVNKLKNLVEIIKKDFIEETISNFNTQIISLVEEKRLLEKNRQKDVAHEIRKTEENIYPLNCIIRDLIKEAEKDKATEIERFDIFKDKAKLTTNTSLALFEYNVNKAKRELNDFLAKKNTNIGVLERNILVVLDKIDDIEKKNYAVNDQNYINNDNALSKHLENYSKKIKDEIDEELSYLPTYDDMVTATAIYGQIEINNFKDVLANCRSKYSQMFKQNCNYQEYYTKKREKELNIQRLEFKKSYPIRLKECKEMYSQELEKKNNTFKTKIYENYITKLDFNKNFKDNLDELERTSALIVSTNTELIKKDQVLLDKYDFNPSYKLKYKTPSLIGLAVASQNKVITKEKE